ncbi:MAG: ROK family protein [Polyangiaceae bacterium]|jgi:fructokinase
MSTERLRLGVDLGGTKTEAIVLREPSGIHASGFEVLARLRVPTERDLGYEHIVANTARLVASVTQAAGLRETPTVGVGMPGSTTLRNSELPLVKNSNTVCLNGRPFQRDLRAALGVEACFANDANCFALAEATFGAAKGCEVVFGVILGTGVGGGIVLRPAGGRARAWNGAQGIAGEWGHVCLDPVDGPPCYCGRRGCVEQYLSGPALEREYGRRTGQARSLAQIAERRAFDSEADDLLRSAMRIFGRAVATVVNVLDPDLIVLGGGVSHLDCLYGEGVESLGAWIFNDEVRTRIVRHALSDSAGVVGAALLPE